MKKIVTFLSSMKFAIASLLFLGIASVAGTLLPQGEAKAFYLERYGQTLGSVITTAGIDRTYTTLWYILSAGLLSISLLLCVVKNTGPLAALVKKQGMKRSLAPLGSWLLHAGMLILIVFFALSSALSFQGTIYNVPGTVTHVHGTDLSVAIHDYQIETREDGTVESYVSTVEILGSDDGVLKEGEIRVNHPMTVDGYQFTQSSWGYAVDAAVKRDEDTIGTAVLFHQEYVSADSGKFFIELVDFYPDYIMTELGPRSASMAMNDPRALYRIYYREAIADMGYASMGEPIRIEEYTVTLDNPRMYTLLAVRRDPYKAGVAVGASLLIAGIMVILFSPPGHIKEEKIL